LGRCGEKRRQRFDDCHYHGSESERRVGKTTTAINLAGGDRAKGRRTLLWTWDPLSEFNDCVFNMGSDDVELTCWADEPARCGNDQADRRIPML